MLTLISHFYNESFLLPWWIRHHKPLFDHAILIDYASTDNSRAIIAELAPGWTVIDSKNTDFDARRLDQEVMAVERGVLGWKLALNTTEFLFCANPKAYLHGIDAAMPGTDAVGIPSICMVDPFPNGLRLDNSKPLHWQRRHGYFDNPYGQPGHSRGFRYAHRAADGRYHDGRHGTDLKHGWASSDLFILWYGWSPWPEVKQRKLQIASRVSADDRAANRGFQHMMSEADLTTQHAALVRSTQLMDISTHARTADIYATAQRF